MILGNALAVGSGVSVGLLSMSSAMLFFPSTIFGLITFALTGVVVGDVYRNSINEALRNIFEKHYMARNYLRELLINQICELEAQDGMNLANTYSDLYMYKKLLLRIARLSVQDGEVEDEEFGPLTDMKREKIFEELEASQKAFEVALLMRFDHARHGLLKGFAQQRIIETTGLNEEKVASFHKTLASIKSGGWRSLGIALISGLAGISMGLSTYGAVAVPAAAGTAAAGSTFFGVFGVTVGGVALSATGYGLAIIAGTAYCLAIRATLIDLCNNEMMKAKWARVKNSISQASTAKKFLIGAAVVLGVALVIGATLVTAGGWWIGVKDGMAGFPMLKGLVKKIFAAICVPAYLLGFAAFALTHTVTTMVSLAQNASWPNFKQGCGSVLKAIAHNPIDALLIKPLSTIFKGALFLAHSVSEAFMVARDGNQSILGFIKLGVFTGCDVTTEGGEIFNADQQAKKRAKGVAPSNFREELEDYEEEEHGLLDTLANATLYLAFTFTGLHFASALWATCRETRAARLDKSGAETTKQPPLSFGKQLYRNIQKSYEDYHGTTGILGKAVGFFEKIPGKIRSKDVKEPKQPQPTSVLEQQASIITESLRSNFKLLAFARKSAAPDGLCTERTHAASLRLKKPIEPRAAKIGLAKTLEDLPLKPGRIQRLRPIKNESCLSDLLEKQKERAELIPNRSSTARMLLN